MLKSHNRQTAMVLNLSNLKRGITGVLIVIPETLLPHGHPWKHHTVDGLFCCKMAQLRHRSTLPFSMDSKHPSLSVTNCSFCHHPCHQEKVPKQHSIPYSFLMQSTHCQI
jgi:hypothetical protein